MAGLRGPLQSGTANKEGTDWTDPRAGEEEEEARRESRKRREERRGTFKQQWYVFVPNH